MQTSDAQSEILLRLPEKIQVALEAYAVEKEFPVETVIEMAISSFLDEQLESDEDPAVGAFLKFLEKDIIEHPERLQTIDSEWLKSAQALVEGVETDLDASLPDDDSDD